jgi:hypothetical protein
VADSSTYWGCGSSPPSASAASSAQASSLWPGRWPRTPQALECLCRPGAYTYGYVVVGEGIVWFIGWDLLYTAIVAVVGIGIAGYFGFLVEQLGRDVHVHVRRDAGVVLDVPRRVAAQVGSPRSTPSTACPFG